ncbi:hypothetical protein [Herbaspirillum huttiense]|uniref:hypothetical protein n=1 Tax=Herbaspirillum huttiense TaxID=863372 RepID=UPI0039AF6B4E
MSTNANTNANANAVQQAGRTPLFWFYMRGCLPETREVHVLHTQAIDVEAAETMFENEIWSRAFPDQAERERAQAGAQREHGQLVFYECLLMSSSEITSL